MAALLQEEGAEIVVRWAAARFVVRSAGAVPIEGADVHVALLAPDMPLPTSGTTDGQGRAEFRLGDGEYEYVVAAEGFLPRRARSTLRVEQVVVLERVPATTERTVRGFVLRTDGRPVPDALVNLSLETDHAELGNKAVSAQVRTTENGEFTLEAPFPGPFEIGAFHRELGFTYYGPIEVPAFGPVLIYMEDRGSLEFALGGELLTARAFDGAVEYVLIGQRTGHREVGAWRMPPYELRELPVGQYSALFRIPSLGMFGASECLVQIRTEAQPVVVEIRTPSKASGWLVDAGGRTLGGATVEVLPTGPFAQSPPEWRTAHADASGQYQLPDLDGGGLGTAGIRARVELVAGARASVILPRDGEAGSVVVDTGQ
ncbi:MAG: carboxypeptidase-like regulatory domain-containing protein [Planctomycetota bacterium]